MEHQGLRRSGTRGAAALLASLMLLLLGVRPAAATFSIAAVDVETGEIGSAGASCVPAFRGVGAFILSDIIADVGVIHTQAAWSQANQVLARERALEGLAAQAIVDALVANDAQGNPAVRQYGVVLLARDGESAAFTGQDTIDWAGHRTGEGYSVQGNILAGEAIIADMERTFLESDAPLAERLMRALEAAAVVGADTRCAPRETSAQSAFLTVRGPADRVEPALEVIVPDSAPGQEPVTLVRERYDAWLAEQRRPTIYVPLAVDALTRAP